MMFRNILSLAVQGTLRKRRSSILLFSVLLTSFSFAIAALSLVGSISKTNGEFRLNTYGEWYCAIPSGMEADDGWLRRQPWAQTVGRADNYGTIRTEVGQAGFGTLDDDLVRIGRIRLEQGRLPTADNEIAMEADVLSALGYDYALGQEISLTVDIPCQDEFVTVERRYTLCGIIREYSGLWVLNRNADRRLLVSAVVTPAAAEAILSAAADDAAEPLAAPIPQYFLTVEEADWETACASINSWLSSTRTGDFGDIQVSQNTAAYPSAESKEYDAFYVHLIAAVTLVAVLCVYMTQMAREVHSFAVLRSIGITKPQMALLVLTETLLLLLPAVALGIPCGAGLTWLALRLMLYSGSVAIQVAIPYGALLTVIALWAAAVLVSRSITFLITVHTPLTGRMQLQRRTARRVKRLRSALIILLAGGFGAVTVYTGMEAIRPNYLRTYWSLCPAYTIWGDSTVASPTADLIEQVPGVARVDGFGEMELGLSFDGMAEQTVCIYAIDEEGWGETFDFSGIKDEFHRGELVLMCFPEGSGEPYVLPDGPITLTVYDQYGELLTQTAADASVAQIPETVMNRGLYAVEVPYTIICSEAYLKQLLAAMQAGQRWDKYIAGEAFGYDRVYVSVDLNSDYLSTDAVMAALCSEHALKLDNRRQEFQARVQENVQTLILLYSAGICIALVVLLILSSTLSLEAEQERRRFEILRAIGMSKGQMRRRLFAKALLRSLTAAVIGWALYIAYCMVGAQTGFPIDRANGASALLLTAICLIVPLAISLPSLKGEFQS